MNNLFVEIEDIYIKITFYPKYINSISSYHKITINEYNEFCDFVNNKASNWYEALNSASYWGKPFLCIINRCFLTNKMKYTNIKCKIDLIIHDECHSIENTSRHF